MSQARALGLGCTRDCISADHLNVKVIDLLGTTADALPERTFVQASSGSVPLCQEDIRAVLPEAALVNLYEKLAAAVEQHSRRTLPRKSNETVRRVLNWSIDALNACSELLGLLDSTNFAEGNQDVDLAVRAAVISLSKVLSEVVLSYKAAPLLLMAVLAAARFSLTLTALLHNRDIGELSRRGTLFFEVLALVRHAAQLPDVAQLLATATCLPGGQQASVLSCLYTLSASSSVLLGCFSSPLGGQDPNDGRREQQRKIAGRVRETHEVLANAVAQSSKRALAVASAAFQPPPEAALLEHYMRDLRLEAEAPSSSYSTAGTAQRQQRDTAEWLHDVAVSNPALADSMLDELRRQRELQRMRQAAVASTSMGVGVRDGVAYARDGYGQVGQAVHLPWPADPTVTSTLGTSHPSVRRADQQLHSHSQPQQHRQWTEASLQPAPQLKDFLYDSTVHDSPNTSSRDHGWTGGRSGPHTSLPYPELAQAGTYNAGAPATPQRSVMAATQVAQQTQLQPQQHRAQRQFERSPVSESVSFQASRQSYGGTGETGQPSGQHLGGYAVLTGSTAGVGVGSLLYGPYGTYGMTPYGPAGQSPAPSQPSRPGSTTRVRMASEPLLSPGGASSILSRDVAGRVFDGGLPDARGGGGAAGASAASRQQAWVSTRTPAPYDVPPQGAALANSNLSDPLDRATWRYLEPASQATQAVAAASAAPSPAGHSGRAGSAVWSSSEAAGRVSEAAGSHHRSPSAASGRTMSLRSSEGWEAAQRQQPPSVVSPPASTRHPAAARRAGGAHWASSSSSSEGSPSRAVAVSAGIIPPGSRSPRQAEALSRQQQAPPSSRTSQLSPPPPQLQQQRSQSRHRGVETSVQPPSPSSRTADRPASPRPAYNKPGMYDTRYGGQAATAAKPAPYSSPRTAARDIQGGQDTYPRIAPAVGQYVDRAAGEGVLGVAEAERRKGSTRGSSGASTGGRAERTTGQTPTRPPHHQHAGVSHGAEGRSTSVRRDTRPSSTPSPSPGRGSSGGVLSPSAAAPAPAPPRTAAQGGRRRMPSYRRGDTAAAADVEAGSSDDDEDDLLHEEELQRALYLSRQEALRANVSAVGAGSGVDSGTDTGPRGAGSDQARRPALPAAGEADVGLDVDESGGGGMLVGGLVPLTVLHQRYAQVNQLLCAKLVSLEDEFNLTRRVAGDGNCFYRAALFALLEHVLTVPDPALGERLEGVFAAHLRRLEPHARSGSPANPRVPTARSPGRAPPAGRGASPTATAVTAAAEGGSLPPAPDPEAAEGGRHLLRLLRRAWYKAIDTAAPSDVSSLERLFNDSAKSSEVIRFARSLTVRELMSAEEFYAPFINGCGRDYEGLGLRDICKRHVLPMGKEVEQLQIIALCSALGATVAVLDVAGSQVGAIKHGPAGHPGPPVAWVAHLPGHYDVVYPSRPLDVAPGGALVITG